MKEMLNVEFKLPTSTYALHGVYFFFTHPKQLWLKTIPPILLSAIFNTFSVGMSLHYLLPRQVEKFLEWNWPHWMSWFISGVSTVLQAAILNLLFFAILVPMFEDAIFDATLRASNLDRIFQEEEELDIPYIILCWRNLRSSLLVTWFLILVKIFLLILTSPLQLVPIVGTFAACYISGWPTAWSHRLHYDIELRGYKVSESYRHAKNYKWKYASFGGMAIALELIPVLNLFFTWTNIIGTGLWVADEYRVEKGIYDETQKKLPSRISVTVYTAAKPPRTDEEAAPLLDNIDGTPSYDS